MGFYITYGGSVLLGKSRSKIPRCHHAHIIMRIDYGCNKIKMTFFEIIVKEMSH